MDQNDENLLLLRGDRDTCDAYVVEFFRLFQHMQFRNRLQGLSANHSAVDAPAICRCRQAVAERVVKKTGQGIRQVIDRLSYKCMVI